MSQEIEKLIHRINRAWLDGRPEEMEPFLHPDVVMVFPGFTGRTGGAGAMIAGFSEFCASAKVLEFEESNIDVDVIDRTAVATFTFNMLYERSGQRYQCSGRDLWILAKVGGDWRAIWRTMVDVQEEEA